eukprot:Hpha_TRINITY_DN16430_c2_g1::TRINITY_DN16430_c2_g1_i4::g.158846::m.158846
MATPGGVRMGSKRAGGEEATAACETGTFKRSAWGAAVEAAAAAQLSVGGARRRATIGRVEAEDEFSVQVLHAEDRWVKVWSSAAGAGPAVEAHLERLLHAPVPWGVSKTEYYKHRQHRLNALCATPHATRLLREFVGQFDGCLEWIKRRKQSGGRAVVAQSPDAVAACVSKVEDFAELMKLPPMERKVHFVNVEEESAEPMKLLEWIDTLPKANPSLGYESYHINTLLMTTIESAVKRERDKIAMMLKRAEVEDWVAALALQGAERGFELFMAGVLYTADLKDMD